MRISNKFNHLILLFFLFFSLPACEDVNLNPPESPPFGLGEVNDFNMEQNIRVALYTKKDLDKNKVKLNYGLMDVNYITLGGQTFIVDWNDQQDFKNIKRTEKLNFRLSDYIAKIEKTGRVYWVVRLNEL